MSNLSTKQILVGLGIVAVGAVAGLYIKNSIEERNAKELTIDQVARVLKLVRREKYILYKQIATFAINIARQTRNNINTQMIEMFLNGPESPIKIPEQIEKITQNVCKAEDIQFEDYSKSLELLKSKQPVADILQQQERDYQLTLSGKMPTYNVTIPESLTKDKYLTLQNQITKKTYMQQVTVFKKLNEHTEEELAQNPQLLAELNNADKEQEEILIEEGLGSEFDPPFAVFEMAGLKFRGDPTMRMQLSKIEEGYQRILMKYTIKIQNKTITAQELNDMQDEVIFYDPIS